MPNAGQHRVKCETNKHGNQHSSHDGDAKLMKELPNDAFHKSDGQKYGHDGQGGGQHGKSNFLSANHGSVIGLFTHLHMSNDVFSNHNGVVNQEPDTQ